MKQVWLFIVLLISGISLNAQTYVIGGNTRHRFAQLNIGFDYRFLANKNTQSYNLHNGILQSIQLAPLHETRIIIGGTHFWGHADFFVAFPLTHINFTGFKTGVETGSKYYPWRLEINKFRPFIGAGWVPTSFYKKNGTLKIDNNVAYTVGVTFQKQNILAEFSTGLFHKNQTNYYFNEFISQLVSTHRGYISIAFKYVLETTLSAEKDWESGKTQELTQKLAQFKKLNGFTLAAGPSVAIFMGESSYNQINIPALHHHKFSNLFGDLGLGYYIHNPDIQVNFAFRSIKSLLSAYNHLQLLHRKAFTLESFKFFADFHGFVPFIGPALSYENLKTKQYYNDILTENASYYGFKPGLTLGWDIRPNRLQTFILRTNLRWFPNLKTTMKNAQTVNFSQLEFNFIQLVIFPNRIFKTF